MTAAQIIAIVRHIITFFAGGVTFLAAIHVLSTGDAQIIEQSLTKIGSDIADICVALAPIIAAGSAVWAAHKQAPSQQIKSVNALEGVKVTSQNAPGAVITTLPKI